MIRQARAFGTAAGLLLLLCAGPASAQSGNGRLAGIVVDFAGKPRMGAAVWVVPQDSRARTALQSRTNPAGHFVLNRLPLGAYTVRVTLAGYMPALSRNIVVSAGATTVVKVELDSVYSSLVRLRQNPQQPAEADDWEWVLRTASDTRSVLRWQQDGGSAPGSGTDGGRKPRARVEITSGGSEPGIVSSGSQSAFAYDQSLGILGKLFLAGQVGYDSGSTAGVATTWAPFGTSADAPRSTFVVRQYRLGEQGPIMRAFRSEQAGGVQMGDRVTLHYAAEYVWLSFNGTTSSLRPRADLSVKLARTWTATLSGGSRPVRGQLTPANLESAVGQLDAFPALMFRDGEPVIEGAWHEEVRLAHDTSRNGEIAVAVFRDRSPNTPVFATSLDGVAQPLDALPVAHAIDGGLLSSYGARVAYRQKFGEGFDAALVYAYASALTADGDAASLSALRDNLQERNRHSVAAQLGGRVPRSKTRITASYKWVNGPEVTRQDAYGEVLYALDPYLNFSIHQPLPALFGCGKVEAVADLLNVLGEGAVVVSTPDGRVRLNSAPRIVRGGLSFQF